VVLLKDTSLLSAIGANEIMKRGQIYNSQMFEPFATYGTVALVYLVVTFSLTRVINWYERKLDVSRA
jgi:polar amino acid ABC transporter, inner membrane subunit